MRSISPSQGNTRFTVWFAVISITGESVGVGVVVIVGVGSGIRVTVGVGEFVGIGDAVAVGVICFGTSFADAGSLTDAPKSTRASMAIAARCISGSSSMCNPHHFLSQMGNM
jgi:hypothetical protein